MADIPDDDLTFARHWQTREQFTLGGNPETVEYFKNEAHSMHSLCVADALNGLQIDALRLSSGLSNKDAIYFMRFGVGRRVGMLRAAYRNLTNLVPCDRKEPLSLEEGQDLCRDINVIYINIVGTLDNYAWCLLHQIGSSATKKLRPSSVGLFSAKLMKDAAFSPLSVLDAEFGAWFKELTTRRHPAAHQIPLYIPSALVDPDEYQKFEHQIEQARKDDKKALADELMADQGKLGRLVPWFLHHPEEPIIHVYPTVSEDIGCMIKIARRVERFLVEAGNAKPKW